MIKEEFDSSIPTEGASWVSGRVEKRDYSQRNVLGM